MEIEEIKFLSITLEVDENGFEPSPLEYFHEVNEELYLAAETNPIGDISSNPQRDSIDDVRGVYYLNKKRFTGEIISGNSRSVYFDGYLLNLYENFKNPSYYEFIYRRTRNEDRFRITSIPEKIEIKGTIKHSLLPLGEDKIKNIDLINGYFNSSTLEITTTVYLSVEDFISLLHYFSQISIRIIDLLFVEKYSVFTSSSTKREIIDIFQFITDSENFENVGFILRINYLNKYYFQNHKEFVLEAKALNYHDVSDYDD